MNLQYSDQSWDAIGRKTIFLCAEGENGELSRNFLVVL